MDKRVEELTGYLEELFPAPKCALYFGSPYQLLVATILSAQCTDKQVNKITPILFAKYPDAEAMSAADLSDIEKIIRPIGLYKNKAKNILSASRDIVAKFGGNVPQTMEELTSLAGVGRKTANVVLGSAFGIPGMVVDTHIKRIARRYGMTTNEDPVKIERDLMALVPKEKWTDFSHQMVFFGRAVCEARNPKCAGCRLANICPSAVKK